MTYVNESFHVDIHEKDTEVMDAIIKEYDRQQMGVELIASENIVSIAVLQAQGSVLTNKYAEGYPGRRYYGGCEAVDIVENIAIERVKKLFGADYANVQPHSGSQANQAVFLTLLQPHDKVMGMDLAAGGHLTHGAKPNMSGKWFDIISYGVKPDSHEIDYDAMEKLALEHKPKLIIAGASAYALTIDFKRFREIADKVGAFLMADIAHIAGLVATGEHPSPFPHAHIVTSTTHKTLRGPRGGLILTNDESLAKKVNSAIFPGLQGGPLMHVIAAKAVAFGEALQDDYKDWAKQVIKNAKALANRLQEHGFKLAFGGTENHLLVLDVTPYGINGKQAEESLERAAITCNKNAIPFDSAKPTAPSGIRLGTPACTTRGFTEKELEFVADKIAYVLKNLSENVDDNSAAETKVKAEIMELCKEFPIYEG